MKNYWSYPPAVVFWQMVCGSLLMKLLVLLVIEIKSDLPHHNGKAKVQTSIQPAFPKNTQKKKWKNWIHVVYLYYVHVFHFRRCGQRFIRFVQRCWSSSDTWWFWVLHTEPLRRAFQDLNYNTLTVVLVTVHSVGPGFNVCFGFRAELKNSVAQLCSSLRQQLTAWSHDNMLDLWC